VLKKVGESSHGDDPYKKGDLFDKVMDSKHSVMHGDEIGEVCKDCVSHDHEDDDDCDDDKDKPKKPKKH